MKMVMRIKETKQNTLQECKEFFSRHVSLFMNRFQRLWSKSLFRVDRHGNDPVMFRAVEIVMAPAYVDDRKPGP